VGWGSELKKKSSAQRHIYPLLSLALSLHLVAALFLGSTSAAALRRCCRAASVAAAAARRQRTVDNILRHSSATPRIERFAAAGYDAWRVVSLLLIICCCCLYSVPFYFPSHRSCVCARVCLCLCVCLCVLPPKSPKTPHHHPPSNHSAEKNPPKIKKKKRKDYSTKGKTSKRECVLVKDI